MPQVIHLSTGGTATFPDEMSRDDIANILKSSPPPSVKQEQKQPSPKKFDDLSAYQQYKTMNPGDYGTGKVMHAAGVLGKDVLDLGGKALRSTIQQGDAGIGQIFHEPGRALKNLAGVGGAGLARNIVNIPHDLPKFLEHIGFIKPETTETAEKVINKVMPYKKVPEVEDEIRNLLKMGEKQKGDTFLSGIVENLPMIAPVTKGALSAIPAIRKGSRKFVGKTDPLLKVQETHLQDKVAKETENVAKIKEEARLQQEALDEAKAKAKREMNVTDEDSMVYKISQTNKKLEEAKAKQEELNSALTQIESPPKAPSAPKDFTQEKPESKAFEQPNAPEPLSTRHEENIRKAEEAEQISASNIEKAKEHHENTQSLVSKAEQDIKEHLNVGSAHGVHVGEHLKQHDKKTHEKLKEDYREFTDSISKDQLPSPNVNVKIKPTGNPVFDENIKLAPKASEKDAGKFLTTLKDFGTRIYELGKLKKETPSAQERAYLNEAIPKLKSIEEKAKKALYDSIGTKKAEKLQELNKRYQNLYETRKSPVMKEALRSGKVKGNIAEKLSGSGAGQSLVKDIISRDPNMVRHVVGQQYPKSLHEQGEIIKEWTDQLPQVKSLLEAKKQTEKMAEQAKAHVEKSNKAHAVNKQESIKKRNEAVRARNEQRKLEAEHKSNVSAINKEKSAHEKRVKEYESAVAKHEKEKDAYHKKLETHQVKNKSHEKQVQHAEKQIEDHKNHIKSLEKDRERLEHHEKETRKEADKLNLTLQQKFQAEKKHKQAKEELNKLDKKILNETNGFFYYLRMAKFIYKKLKGI